MKENVQLMRDAKASLKGNWGVAALSSLIMTLVLGASGFLFVGPLLIGGSMTVGYINFIKKIKAGQEAKLEVIFSGFSDFLRAFLSYLLMVIFIFLWALLLYIPGIIMAFAYSMTFFILADDDYKDVSAREAIRRSKNMMKGYKWKYFCLQLRFIGWVLLSCLTFGILLFWVMPYMEMACLNFYEEVKAEWESRQNAEAAFAPTAAAAE